MKIVIVPQVYDNAERPLLTFMLTKFIKVYSCFELFIVNIFYVRHYENLPLAELLNIPVYSRILCHWFQWSDVLICFFSELASSEGVLCSQPIRNLEEAPLPLTSRVSPPINSVPGRLTLLTSLRRSQWEARREIRRRKLWEGEGFDHEWWRTLALLTYEKMRKLIILKTISCTNGEIKIKLYITGEIGARPWRCFKMRFPLWL